MRAQGLQFYVGGRGGGGMGATLQQTRTESRRRTREQGAEWPAGRAQCSTPPPSRRWCPPPASRRVMGGGASKAKVRKAVDAVSLVAPAASSPLGSRASALAEVITPGGEVEADFLSAAPASGDMGNISVDLATANAAPAVSAPDPAPIAELAPEPDGAGGSSRPAGVSFSEPEPQQPEAAPRRLTTPGRRSRVPSRPQTAEVPEALDSPLRTPPTSADRQRSLMGRPPSRDGPLAVGLNGGLFTPSPLKPLTASNAGGARLPARPLSPPLPAPCSSRALLLSPSPHAHAHACIVHARRSPASPRTLSTLVAPRMMRLTVARRSPRRRSARVFFVP